jgi:cytochrome b561
VTNEGRFYTPHTYIGLAVMLLFLGRLAYRFLYLATDPGAAAAYQRSPLTLGTFGLLVGYYLLYYAGILLRTRASAPPAPDVAPAPE